MKKTLLIIAFIAALPAATLFAAPSPMREGNWEITVKMDMEGMPFPMPPMTVTHCITKEDLKDPKKTLPSSSDKKNECTTKDYSVSGTSVTWKVTCQDGSTGSGKMTYKGGTSYSGTMTMVNAGKKRGSKMVQHISGKRIGDCK